MANSVQKKIKFSKGQVAPELIERTDLDLYNSSAQEMTNLISTVYGGFRTRRGTRYMSDIYTSTTEGTATTNIGGTASNIQDLTNKYTSGNIGNTRDLIKIDYKDVIVGGNFKIKNIKTDFLSFFKATSNSSYTVSEELGKIRVDCVGAKGFDGDVTGGKGGRVLCNLNVSKEQKLNINVGDIPTSSKTALYNASDIRINGNNLSNRIIVSGGGGSGGTGGGSQGTGGAGGGLTGGEAISSDYQKGGFGGTQSAGGLPSYRSGGNTSGWWKAGNGALGLGGSGGDAGTTTFGGAGGAGYYGGGGGSIYLVHKVGTRVAPGGGGSSYTDAKLCTDVVHTQGYNNGKGYVSLGLVNAKILIMTSIDDVDYEQKAVYEIGSSEEDISVTLSSFRYVKLVLDAPSSLNITGKIYFDYVRLNSNISSKVKLIPYIYNNEQEYVLALQEKRISVYEKGIFKQEIQAETILGDYIKDIKYTSKDDTIILTHPDMKTLEIRRENNMFTLKEFELKNIPYYAFGGETKTKYNTKIKPSGVEGAIKITATSDLFDSSWVGQKIDGNGGIVRITEYVSKTVINGVTVIPFYTDDDIEEWDKLSGYEAVWSDKRGYPRTCLFAQQRLWFGGSRDLPSHLWASRLGDYNNFKNAGNYDNDSIDVTLLTNNAILNLVEQRGIHVFTSGEEWTASESSLTPDGFSIVKNTANGSKSITPVVIGGVIMFVEKMGRSLLGYVYNYEQASFVADNLSIFSKLINTPVSMAVETNSNIDSGDFLFMVLEDGTMLTACVALKENIFSISRFVTDGKVKDICCLATETYIAVDRDGKLYLEKLTMDNTDQTQEFYVNGDIINNLDEYNNKSIYVKYDNTFEKVDVYDGKALLETPYTGYVTAGIPFSFKLQSNPIAINNETETKKKRISKATLVCKDTEVLTLNGQTKRKDFTYYACTKYDTDVRFEVTGEYYPINVLSITLNLNFEG